jgi:hypothetical protein
MQILLRIFCVLFLGFLWTASAFAEPGVIRHQVREGDCIRSLLLRYNCLSSMLEYAQVRESFARLNPGIQYSGQLTAGAVLSVPSIKSGKKGCMAFQDARVVRVEFESIFLAERVRIHLDGPVLPDLFLLDKTLPMRVVCDFDGALPQPDLVREVDCQGRMIHKIRIGHEDKPYQRARVVLDVDENLMGRIEQEFFERESQFVLTIYEGGQ